MAWRATLALFLFAALLPASLNADAIELSGRVESWNGEPVANATVWINQYRDVRNASTDDDGEFLFDDVKTGYAEIVAVADGYSLGGLDVYVVASDRVVLRLYEPDEVRVRVVDQRYQPVEGAQVKTLYVNSAFHATVADLANAGFPSLRTDDEGRVTVPSLPKGGHVSFSVRHRRYAEGHTFMFPVGQELTVILHDGVKLRGRVTNSAGRGVQGAELSVFREMDGEVREYAEASTDSEGFYSTTVRGGQYYVAVHHPEYAPFHPRAVRIDESSEDNLFDAALSRAAFVEGEVVLENGEGVVGVPLAYISETAVLSETRSGPEGAYQLRVAQGPGLVRVYPPEGMVTQAFPDSIVQIDEPGTIELAKTVLEKLPVFTGRVVDEGGDPVPNALVSSVGLRYQALQKMPNQSAQLRTLTDDEGRFEIALPRMPEDKRIEFVAEHPYRFSRQSFKLTLDKPEAERVRLKPFEPNLESAKPERVYNALDHIVGKAAFSLECDAWFNLPEGVESLSLAELRGDVVVLTFWGGFAVDAGAGDHLNEMKLLHEIYKGADDVTIVSIHDAGKEPEEVAEYVEAFGIEFPVGCDADPFMTFDIYGISSIPQTILIGKSGIIRHYDVSGRLLELIKDLRRRAN